MLATLDGTVVMTRVTEATAALQSSPTARTVSMMTQTRSSIVQTQTARAWHARQVASAMEA
jgi:hypothetical protein